MSDDKPETLTDAEIDAFDQKAREQFEQSLRMTYALRLALQREIPADDPRPGTPEAEAAVREAIKQGRD